MIELSGSGKRFDGVGALSNSSTRLLLDYPERERAQILDYLFLPQYGASLHLLKLEIGADTNSTTTAEPSHMRTPDDFGPNRGWNWWIAKEAKARNPEILLAGLMWGAPSWFDGGMWSEDHVRYIVRWLDCASEQGLRVDYIGGGNEWYEPRPDPRFFVALKAALRDAYPDVKVVATDGHTPPDYWEIAPRMLEDAEFSNSVDVLGEHDVCVWRSEYRNAHVSDAARQWSQATGKPLWNSEQSTQDAEAAAPALARAMNRHYIDGRITANLNWSAVAAFYGNTATGGTGLMLAESPWSGHYRVPASIWVDAHTTQFAKPGWRYVDSACGYSPGGASHVALRSPDDAYDTIVVEGMDLTGPETLDFGGLRGTVQIWRSDLRSDDPSAWFVQSGSVDAGQGEGREGRVSVTIQPGELCTLSTWTGARKGSAHPRAGSPGTLSIPYAASFDGTDGFGVLPRYFQDLQGGFEMHDGELRQVVESRPIPWHDSALPPTTILGDPFWWGDYTVSADVRLPEGCAAELLGRVEYYDANVLLGYRLRLASDGSWRLHVQNASGEYDVLASGTAPASAPDERRTLGLEFQGSTIRASIDSVLVTEATDRRHASGQVGLATVDWHDAGFSRLTVDPVGPAPAFPAPQFVTGSASNARLGLHEHHTYGPERAMDGRIETRWMTAEDGVLPQHLTVDLGSARDIYGVVYRPPVHPTASGTCITSYRLEASVDGRAYDMIASGHWEATSAAKVVSWDSPLNVRWVRLIARESPSGTAAATALDVALSPIPEWWG